MSGILVKMQEGDITNKSTPQKRTKFFIAIIILILVVLVSYLVSSTFTFYTQKGNAMMPTYKNGASLLTLQKSLLPLGLHRGSVVIFKEPSQPYPISLMRIVGLPGEKIMLEAGSIYINASKLDETPYLHHTVATYGEPYLDDGLPRNIPSDMYVVMGDNRQFSLDSRTWGFVPKENIRGLVFLCLGNCK